MGTVNNNDRFTSITTDDTTPDHITDDVDFPHTGLFKALSLGMKGNYVMSGFNITSTTDTSLTVAAGVVMRDGKKEDILGATLTLSTTYTNGYHLLVAPAPSDEDSNPSTPDTSTVVLRNPSAQDKVANYTNGDVIIAVVTHTGNNPMQIQFLTVEKKENSLTVGYDSSGYTETGTITGDNTGIDITATRTDADINLIPNGTGKVKLGKDLATNSNDIRVADNDKIFVGTDEDLQLFHDTANNHIYSASRPTYLTGGGNLYLRPKNGEDGIILNTDGAAEIYHDNSKKLETTTTGVAITGNATTTGNVTATGNVAATVQLSTAGVLNLRHDVETSIAALADCIVYLNAGGAHVLPPSGTHTSQVFYFKNVNAASAIITPAGAETIDIGAHAHDRRLTGPNTITLAQYESIFLQAVNDTAAPLSVGWMVLDLDTSGIGDVVDDTTPQLGGDLDANGHAIQFNDATGIEDDDSNEQLYFLKTASAVNYLTITNSATGNRPAIGAGGSDTNVGIELQTKGTGDILLDGNTQVETSHTFSAALLASDTKTTSTLALSDAGKYLFVTASGQTLTLPTSHSIGQQYTILANGNDVTLSSSDNMNGSSSDITISSYNGVTCISDGTNWIVLGA